MTAAVAPESIRLHLPDEPAGRGAWLATVLDGSPVESVLAGDDGVAAWLWRRWRYLAQAGWTEEGFGRVVLAYRRELWLWLMGDRRWDQCCAGLIGRIGRRTPA